MTQVEALVKKLQTLRAISISNVVCSTGLLRDVAQIICMEYCTWEHLLTVETFDEKTHPSDAKITWCALDKLNYKQLADASIQCRQCRLYHPVWSCIIIPTGQVVICYGCNYRQAPRAPHLACWSCRNCLSGIQVETEADIYPVYSHCDPCFLSWYKYIHPTRINDTSGSSC